ncbi:hypothetical protein XCR_0276 [Xanthomonas campestris pv. raphani 756C]|nr:hypothetical protein XCR_0276 [Xanthomonas campestris pv. raphani 756C]
MIRTHRAEDAETIALRYTQWRARACGKVGEHEMAGRPTGVCTPRGQGLGAPVSRHGRRRQSSIVFAEDRSGW